MDLPRFTLPIPNLQLYSVTTNGSSTSKQLRFFLMEGGLQYHPNAIKAHVGDWSAIYELPNVQANDSGLILDAVLPILGSLLHGDLPCTPPSPPSCSSRDCVQGFLNFISVSAHWNCYLIARFCMQSPRLPKSYCPLRRIHFTCTYGHHLKVSTVPQDLDIKSWRCYLTLVRQRRRVPASTSLASQAAANHEKATTYFLFYPNIKPVWDS